MAQDEQHVTVRCANKEASHSPRFVLQRVDDLVAAPLRFFVGRVVRASAAHDASSRPAIPDRTPYGDGTSYGTSEIFGL